MNGHLVRLARVGIFQCPRIEAAPPKPISPNQELVEILTAGKIKFDVNGKETIFTRGTVFWHQEGDETISKTFPDDPYRCIVLTFDVNEKKRPGPRISQWPDPNEAVAFAYEWYRAFHAGAPDLKALGEFAYSMLSWRAICYDSYHPINCPPILLNAFKYMKQHLDQELTPDIIAHAVGISRPYLFALFQKHYGKAPYRFLQELRIKLAKTLLTTGDDISIKEVAANCGFRDLKVFYRQFKSQVEITPAAYRKKFSVR